MSEHVLADLYQIPPGDSDAFIRILIEHGLPESDACTAYRAMLTSLAPAAVNTDVDHLADYRVVPEPEAKAAAYATLGFSRWEGQGDLRSLAQAIWSARERLDSTDYLVAMATVFGVDGLRAAHVLGQSELAKWTPAQLDRLADMLAEPE